MNKIQVELLPHEKEIYNAFFLGTKNILDKYLKTNNIDKKYCHIFMILTRLR